MKKLFALLFILCSIQLLAQTGIGTSTPNTSAKLDVYSDNKGFLPPRVSLTDVYDRTTIASPATGLLVYCKGNAGLAAGYYFWNGNAWATIATEGGSGSVAAEYGSQILGTGVSVTSSTPVDVLSFTLPSAGTWELIYFLRAQGNAGFAGEYAVFDPTGILVPNSEILCAYGEIASTGTGIVRVTTNGSATYKIKAWASTGTYAASTDPNGRTGVTWKKISGNAPVTVINYGDVKTGFQAGDHNGWIKLDGRAKSTLSSTQQAQATILGIGVNLPDASNAYLSQNGTSLGSMTGSNTKTIDRANLPNVTLSGTTSTNGNHTHGYSVDSSPWAAGGNSVTNVSNRNNDSNFTSDSYAGSHSHTFTTNSINGNVTQTALDIRPVTLSVNVFIYLGN
jgi:hypothetical protein